jgi:oxygen-independent coproporphyrinogen-3 oxidase
MNMIKFVCEGHKLEHEVQTAIQIFFPNVHYYPAKEISDEGITVKSGFGDGISYAAFYKDGKLIKEKTEYFNSFESEKEKKRLIKKPVFDVLSSITGYMPKWGMLTGVRPAKNASELIEKGKDKKEIISFFTDKYLANKRKAELAYNIAVSEKFLLDKNNRDDISIYIGIPFCPTRCLYCSFTSYPIDRYVKKADEYLDKLSEEIHFISERTRNKNIVSVYVGGGTPTSLNENQFEKLMNVISNNFDVRNIEFTVEAGRPDTITEKKLSDMKKNGVTRISINPQTMNQKTLDIIGRRHSVKDIKDAFFMARNAGFDNINMDIILGLPDEDEKDVENTMIEIKKLAPDSLTVHTLAVKRASRLKENMDKYDFTSVGNMEKMIDISADYAAKMGLKPYYMYRQKAMIGNFENVGYCKEGKECIYNIEIMEEKQSIISAGCGATTKLYIPKTNELKRSFNVKSVEDYLSRYKEMIERKRVLLDDENF